MSLEVDQVALVILRLALEEVVEADLVERRGGGVGGNVATNPLLITVRTNNHSHGVPANNALDTILELTVSRVPRLL